MRWQNKMTWSQLIAASAIYEIKKDEKFTLGDVWTLTGAAVSIGAIWYPEIRVAAATAAAPYAVPAGAAVAVPVAAGLVTSAIVGGEEGVKDYYEFMTGEVSYDQWKEVVVPAIEQEVMKPIADAGMGALDWILIEGEKQLKRTFPGLHYIL